MTSSLVVTVIPNWNLKADLGECLDSLSRVTYSPHRVVVVDNGSTDGSPDFVTARYPWAHLIVLPQNRGYAAALNAGIVHALALGANYILVLNNDAVVEEEALTRLVDVLAADETIGLAAPKVLYYDHPERIFGLGDRAYRWLPVPLGFGYKWRDRPRFAGIMEFDYVTGCAMLIHAHVFQDVGLFDTGFFMYYEDADFCRRVRERGYRIVCVGDAIVYHKASLSAGKDKAFTRRIRARNRVRFYRRYRHGPHPLLTYLLLGVVALWRSAIDLLRGRGQLVKPYLQGLLEGWREPPIPPRCAWTDGGAL